MRKIKRRKKEPRKIKRRRVKVDRLSSTGKCGQCGKLFLYAFEGENKDQIEKNPKRAKRFQALLDSELCLTCLTDEKNSFKAYELMQLHVMKGEDLKAPS